MSSSKLIIGILGLIVLAIILSPPPSFPQAEMVEITEGSSLQAMSEALAQRRVIRYPFILNSLVALRGKERGVLAGDYWFEAPLTAWEIAGRITRGQFTVEPVKVTIPEGMTVAEMAAIFENHFPYFEGDKLVELAGPLEGYLFPDTYFFPAGVGPGEVIQAMRGNFNRQIKSLTDKLKASERSLGEVVTMASLLEEEAYDPEARRLIAGILWKRLEADMPLQVDAVFPYIIGKNSFELSRDDLQFDSPYNTYRYRGLPPGPISNPGLDALAAALEPVESDYWFYLSDRRGEMYYAEDFAEHKLNKQKYLY